MGRLLFFLILALLAYLFIKSLGRTRTHDKPPRKPGEQQMVRCAHCGLHLPENEAVSADGVHFCSDAHKRLGVRQP